MENRLQRPKWFVGVAGFAIGLAFGIGWFFVTLNADQAKMPIVVPAGSGGEVTGGKVAGSKVTGGELTIDDFDPSVAKPTYGPQDVVRLQLTSLQKAASDPSALIVCYSLASADNRRVTGPMARFAELIRTDAYRPLLGHVSSMIGRPTMDGDKASVTATVISNGGQSCAYEFMLARYLRTSDGDNDDAKCWMTYSVAPIFAAPLSSSDGFPETDGKSFR